MKEEQVKKLLQLDASASIMDVVNTKISTLHPKDTIARAEELFNWTKKNIIPVIVDDRFCGVIIKQEFKSINKANQFIVGVGSARLDISRMLVQDFYNKDTKVLESTATLQDCIEFFLEYRQYFIPVLDKERFLGLVTPFDIFNKLINS